MIDRQKYGWISGSVIILVLLFMSPMAAWAQTDLPDIPDISRVTVDHFDQGILIQWESSTDTDIEFYSIYRQRDGAFELIATVGTNTLEFKHMSGGGENIAYSVTAIDSLGNESLFEQNIHRAVSASVAFDPCTPSNEISWNEYQGWKEGTISGYKIYGGPSGATLQMLTFVPSSTLSYSHEEISVGSTYDYYIETVHTSGLISLSAIETVSSLYPEAPQFLTVDYVTVVDASTIELQFTADVSGPVNHFRVLKRSNPGTPFIEVVTLWNASQSTQVIQDQFPTSSNSYEFMVQSIYQPTACNAPIVISESNAGTSILLDYELEDQIVTLNWIPYLDFVDGLSGYVIQRRGGNGEFYDIQSVGPVTTAWSETVQSIINGFQPGELEYKVVAIENLSGASNQHMSLSNIITVTVETNLQVPSAFTPGSNNMNFEFKPIIDFAPKDYVMIVMDRGGRKMFETTDPGDGWDGRFQSGEFVNEGVYVYYIQFTDYTGLFKSFTGNVTVLYP